MKKIIAFVLLVLIAFTSCSHQESELPGEFTEKSVSESSNDFSVKSVWITYYELQNILDNRDENAFSKEINQIMNKLSKMGFNTVTVQVRPCSDAFYPSKYFPASKYSFGKQGNEMKYDPLKIICEKAESNNINVEAWINPYRVSQDNDIEALDENNPAKKWYDNKKTKSHVYIMDKGIYYNPACQKVTDLIVNGVREIVENYNICAIHFDDYFYPTTEKDIDSAEYKAYQKKGGKMSLSDWRRDNINNMVKSVYNAVKKANSSVKFGISPASNINNDYSKLYADVEKWASEEGFCDYICPQIYFGFKNVYQPFMFTTKKWIGVAKKDLYVGLPLYKCGKADKYAANEDKSIINEFKNNNNIISRQITYLSKLDEIKGFYIFSYSFLDDEKCKEEVENMLKVMQGSSQDFGQNL